MKNLFLCISILVSGSVSAAADITVFPNVYNYGGRAEVQVWNHTDKTIRCSGWVDLRLESGRSESDYYFDTVPPRSNSYRSVYPRNFQDRIRFVSHSIFCN